MNWLERLSRNLGLMVHNIKNPEGPSSTVKPVSRTVEQQQINPTTILRRTTIEEVEIRHSEAPGQDNRPK